MSKEDKLIDYLLELLEDREQKIHDLEGANKQKVEIEEESRTRQIELMRKVALLEKNDNRDLSPHYSGGPIWIVPGETAIEIKPPDPNQINC